MPIPRSLKYPSVKRLKGLLPDLLALMIIGLTSLAITFPLILHLTDLIPGFPGDNLQFFWELWWVKRALLDLHISPFVDQELFYPVGFELARDEITAANTVLGLPLTALFGPAVSYNLLTLGSFLLSGYAVYRFIFESTDNRWAALIGGLAFVIAPYRVMHLFGHLNLLATQWFVLSLLFLERLFRFRRSSDGALAGILFGLNALAAWYYLYIGTVAITIFAGIRMLPWRESFRDRRLWYGLIWFVLLVGILVIPFAIPYLQLRERGDLQRSFTELDNWSANLTDFFQPNPLHPIWGKAVRQVFPFQWKAGIERNLMFGWLLLGLAIVGAWTRRRDRTAQALAVLAIASLVIAMGPTLHWGGKRVEYDLPPSVIKFAEQTGATTALATWLDPSLAESVRAGHGFIPLPAALMYATVPVTSSLRAILRFGFVTFVAVAMLAGYGVVVLLRAAPKRKYAQQIVAMSICGLVLFELWSGIPDDFPHWTEIRARPVDVWLAAQSDQSVLIEFPYTENDSTELLLHQTFNRQRLVLGSAIWSFKPPVYYERAKRLKDFPSADALAALREWNTRYVLVTPALFPSKSDWQRFQAALAGYPELQLVNDIGGVLVYELR